MIEKTNYETEISKVLENLSKENLVLQLRIKFLRQQLAVFGPAEKLAALANQENFFVASSFPAYDWSGINPLEEIDLKSVYKPIPALIQKDSSP